MHALIETGTLTDRGNRKDFGGDTPPDLSHKNPPLKWVPVVKAADPAFDPLTHKLQKAADVITLTELTQGKEAVALTQAEADRANREAQRETMRTSWAGLNASVRGNYQWLFDSVQTFLDAGDDDLAVIAVQEVDPNEAIANTPARLTNFNNTKAQFVATIQALTPLP